ncbi:hypothetical protein Tco_0102140, partial [Tanacetum coccineum]
MDEYVDTLVRKIEESKLVESLMREADLSKDTSDLGPSLELWRSWCVEGHVRSRAIIRTLEKLVCRRTRQLGDAGSSSGGTKLNSTFITAEVTFTEHNQPT